MCTTCMPSVHIAQKMASTPLELELQAFVSHPVGAGNLGSLLGSPKSPVVS